MKKRRGCELTLPVLDKPTLAPGSVIHFSVFGIDPRCYSREAGTEGELQLGVLGFAANYPPQEDHAMEKKARALDLK